MNSIERKTYELESQLSKKVHHFIFDKLFVMILKGRILAFPIGFLVAGDDVFNK